MQICLNKKKICIILTGLKIDKNGSTFESKWALARVYYLWVNLLLQITKKEKTWCVIVPLQAADGPVMKHSILRIWTRASNEIMAICLNVVMLLMAFIFVSVIKYIWKMCVLQMKIHSPSPHKQVPSKCNDYFFNYFTLGVVSGKLP